MTSAMEHLLLAEHGRVDCRHEETRATALYAREDAADPQVTVE